MSGTRVLILMTLGMLVFLMQKREACGVWIVDPITKESRFQTPEDKEQEHDDQVKNDELAQPRVGFWCQEGYEKTKACCSLTYQKKWRAFLKEKTCLVGFTHGVEEFGKCCGGKYCSSTNPEAKGCTKKPLDADPKLKKSWETEQAKAKADTQFWCKDEPKNTVSCCNKEPFKTKRKSAIVEKDKVKQCTATYEGIEEFAPCCGYYNFCSSAYGGCPWPKPKPEATYGTEYWCKNSEKTSKCCKAPDKIPTCYLNNKNKRKIPLEEFNTCCGGADQVCASRLKKGCVAPYSNYPLR